LVGKSFDEFWLIYLRAHSATGTRLFHYVGTAFAVMALVGAMLTGYWWAIAAGVAAGYAFAWAGHFLVQGNTPMAFKGPRAWAYSFVSDLRMFGLAMFGRLGPELERAGVAPA